MDKTNKIDKNCVHDKKRQILMKEDNCGIWVFKWKCLRRFATAKHYAILYSIAGFVLSMTYSYFANTLSAVEKRFGISIEIFSYIGISCEFSQFFIASMLSYVAGKGHRPRWIGVGLLILSVCCFLMALPHLLFGNDYTNLKIFKAQQLTAQISFFTSYIVSSFGTTLFYTLGTSYMDDNFKKSKVPALLSITYLLRLFGPWTGKLLAKLCLSIGKPTFPTSYDVLGAWWLGWLIFGAFLSLFGCLLPMFPKNLPSSSKKRTRTSSNPHIHLENIDKDLDLYGSAVEMADLQLISWKDMLKTFKDFVGNKIFICNHLSTFFFYIASVQYATLMPNYIQIEYRQSANMASLISASVGLIFPVMGLILSGFWITRLKPSARTMAAWNVIVGISSILGLFFSTFLGCAGNEHIIGFSVPSSSLKDVSTCSHLLGCKIDTFTPVCGVNNLTYLSACHAGCSVPCKQSKEVEVFYDCACVPARNRSRRQLDKTELPIVVNDNWKTVEDSKFDKKHGEAYIGACSLNCTANFVAYVVIMAILRFLGVTVRAAKFLINVRSVPKGNKSAAIGFDMTIMSLVTLLSNQSCVYWLFDKLFALWGNAYVIVENGWKYDAVFFRYIFNLSAIVFITTSTLFDIAVWQNVKNLRVFDEENKLSSEIRQEHDEPAASKLLEKTV